MELFTQIRDIKAKAAESEAMVRDITRDIKQVSELWSSSENLLYKCPVAKLGSKAGNQT
jgi:hypothetical protein